MPPTTQDILTGPMCLGVYVNDSTDFMYRLRSKLQPRPAAPNESHDHIRSLHQDNEAGHTTQTEFICLKSWLRRRYARSQARDSESGCLGMRTRLGDDAREADLNDDTPAERSSPSGEGAQDDVDTGHLRNARHTGNSQPSQPTTSFILVCLGVGGRYSLVQLDRREFATEERTFLAIRDALKSRFLLRRLLPAAFFRVNVDFVQFKVFDRHGSAVIVKSPDYPPESQAHEYYPCGKPSVSVEVLRYFYCNPSRIRDVRENFLDKIPNKLHRILLSDPDCKVLGPDCARNGWGIRVTEDPDWKLLALGALASPMLILVVLYSTTRGFLLVTVCVGTVVCLFSTSLRDLVRVLQLRDQQHRDGPMRITQAAQQQAEGSEGSGKGSGSESSSEKDIEAGTTKPSGKERSCISQFLYPSMRKGKDDEDGELKRHRRPMEDPELDGLLQLCVYNSSDGLPELRQEPVARFSSDYEFFIWLKRLCGRPSPWSWRGFLTRCGLRTVIGINYCKIELHPNDRASIDDEPSYPPYALRSSYQPTQAGDDDSSAPNTSSQGFSWFNPGVLADFYHNPSRLWKEHGTGANRFYVLKRFVRKLDGHLLYNGSGSLGYAMEVQEGPDLFRVMVLQTAMMFVAIIVGIICGVATGDVQNGCAIAACLAFLFKGIIQLLEKS